MPDLVAELRVGRQFFKTGLEEAKADFAQFAEQAAGTLAASFGAGAVLEGIRAMAERAKAILADAAQTGSTTQDIQLLGNAAERTNSSLEAVVGSLSKLTKSAQLAATEGNKAMIESFKRLGISVDDLRNKTSAELFYQIADGIREGKDEGNQMVDVMALMGRGAAEMLPILQKGAEGIKDLGHEGLVIDKQQLEDLKTIEESWKAVTVFGERFLSTLLKIGESLFVISMLVPGLLNKIGIGKFSASPGEALGGLKQIWGIDQPKEKGTGAADQGANTPDDGDAPGGGKKKSSRAATASFWKAVFNDAADYKRKLDESDAQYTARLADIATRAALRQLAPAERLVELAKQRLDLEKQLAAAQDLDARKLIQARIVDNAEQQNATRDELAATDKKTGATDEAAQKTLNKSAFGDYDSLRQIGGSLAGVRYGGDNTQAQQQLTVARQQLDQLKGLRSDLKSLRAAPAASTSPARAATFGHSAL